LLSQNDGTFKNIGDKKDGKGVSYVQAYVTIYDIDDDKRGFIQIASKMLLCFEEMWKDGKKEGQCDVYVIDSLDHHHRYKIWEQHYKNDKLQGEWRHYTLAGTLKAVDNFENGVLMGLSRDYGIDGKVIREREYLGSKDHFVEHILFPDGTLERTVPIENGKRNGVGRAYYEGGQLMEEVHFKDDQFHGSRKYFYPYGQLWIEQVYKNGLDWEVVSNFTEDGKRRDAGTLKNGNGTIIFYNEDGSVREVSTFVNGVQR
jgi:antitoxin component YwqK of YwqJK toxin-antitoxin module